MHPAAPAIMSAQTPARVELGARQRQNARLTSCTQFFFDYTTINYQKLYDSCPSNHKRIKEALQVHIFMFYVCWRGEMEVCP